MKKRFGIILLSILIAVCLLFSATACNEEINLPETLRGIIQNGTARVAGMVFDVKGNLPEGAEFIVEKLSSGQNYQEAVDAVQTYLRDPEATLFVYDISVEKNGVKIQPDGSIEITLDAPNANISEYTVFHIKKDGSIEKVRVTSQNGKIVFRASSFSNFIIATKYYPNALCDHYGDDKATCVSKAKCAACGAEYGDYSDEHTFGGRWISGQNGHFQTCTLCHDAVSSEQPHNYGKWTPQPDNGIYHGRECAQCGHVQSEEHEWGEGVVTDDPTNAEIGIRTYTCKVCNGTKTERFTKPHEHTFGGDWISGQNGHFQVCTGCHDAVSSEQPHNYGEWTPLMTALLHERKCAQCGHVQSEEHEWGEGVVTDDPTNAEIGIRTYTCKVCNGTKTERFAKPHVHTFGEDWISGQNGHFQICITCKEKSSEQPHNYGEWTPQPDNGIYHGRECAQCGHVQSEQHEWGEGVVIVEPSDVAEGIRVYTCKVCNATKRESFTKPHEHTFGGDWIIGQNGHYQRCTGCQEAISDEQPHFGGEATCVRMAVCEACGSRYGECDDTNHTFGGDWIIGQNGHFQRCIDCWDAFSDEQPHNYGKWTQDNSPDNSSNQHYRTCADCDHHQWGDHEWGEGVSNVDPSTNELFFEYTCSSCQCVKREYPIDAEALFGIDGHGFSVHEYDKAMVLLSKTGSSGKIYILRDEMEFAFDGGFFVQLPLSPELNANYENYVHEMTWDLNGHCIKCVEIRPEGGIWNIIAPNGGAIISDGRGFRRYNDNPRDIVIKGGIFDFDPTEYLTPDYTAKMLVEPKFVPINHDGDVLQPGNYDTLLDLYGSYSEIIESAANNGYILSYDSHGLWVVYSTKDDVNNCAHDGYIHDDVLDGTILGSYCSLCGKEVEHQHKTRWIISSEQHIKVCATCREEITADEPHTFSQGAYSINAYGEVTVTSICTVCGYVKVETTHSAPSDYLSNNIAHWKKCNVCNETFDYNRHSYGEWIVTVEATESESGIMNRACTVCGYVEEREYHAVHTFETNWTMDETHHWHAPTCGCGSEMNQDFEKHDFVMIESWIEHSATGNDIMHTSYRCTVCAYYYIESHEIVD